MAEKTEEPTEQRLREARARGQVAQTAELTTLLQLSSILAYFFSKGPRLFSGLQAAMRLSLDLVGPNIQSASFSELLGVLMRLFVVDLVPLSLVVILSTLLSHFGQVGFLLATGALAPNFGKLNPMNNLQGLFSLKHLVEVGKSLIKLSLIGFIFYYLLKRYVMTFQFLPTKGLEAALALTIQTIFWLWLSLIGCYFIFALGDYSFQRYLLMQKLRMTKEEIKQEYKNNEGNPEIKSRRREMHREIQSGSLASHVKKSSVVVRNPVHVAVGLYYEFGKTPLPLITEMGRGRTASTIVKIAQEADIPIVENVYLARRLLALGERHKPIPEELMEPVAAMLRTVLLLRERELALDPAPPVEGEEASE